MGVTYTYTVTLDTLGQLLRFWREESGLSLRDVADRATERMRQSITHATVQRYERDLFPVDGPNPIYLAAIVEAVGRKINELPREYRTGIKDAVDVLTRSSRSRAA